MDAIEEFRPVCGTGSSPVEESASCGCNSERNIFIITERYFCKFQLGGRINDGDLA
jgi:hypothetical protein